MKPLGSKRVWLNFWQSTLSGTPYCKASETAVAKQSMSPETVEPSLDIVMNVKLCQDGTRDRTSIAFAINPDRITSPACVLTERRNLLAIELAQDIFYLPRRNSRCSRLNLSGSSHCGQCALFSKTVMRPCGISFVPSSASCTDWPGLWLVHSTRAGH